MGVTAQGEKLAGVERVLLKVCKVSLLTMPSSGGAARQASDRWRACSGE